ncbi:MAG: LysE family translocator [Desulfovibrio sp.]|nr:LysE family translocator [Desulfovibrio sp.]MBI4960257.1 LysE family translocator [Desulfovibrio sp.]
MPLQTYFAFLLASTILLLIPGPTVMLVIAHSLTHGVRRAWWSAIGVALGDATALSCSLLGLGAFLQTSAHLFTILKWAGALYLIWMGYKMLRAEPAAMAGPARNPQGCQLEISRFRLVCQAYLVTALNPKSILFFVAFVPQFITPGPDVTRQMLIILASFVALAFLNSLAYAVLAGSARRAARSPGVLRTFTRLGGSALIGAGIWTAAKESN